MKIEIFADKSYRNHVVLTLPNGKGILVTPAKSLAVWNHSPDGFNWGYGGSGPAQLALAILLACLNDQKIAVALHQKFKWEYITCRPGDVDLHFTFDLRNFLSRHIKREGGNWVVI